MQDYKENEADYEKLLKVFKAHNIGYFFYNGGGDSQDTTNKISEYCVKKGFDIKCIGIPKTVDNDLPLTDCSPGFGSVAKYTAVSTLEAGLDVEAMKVSLDSQIELLKTPVDTTFHAPFAPDAIADGEE